jgi:hypothetical protein
LLPKHKLKTWIVSVLDGEVSIPDLELFYDVFVGLKLYAVFAVVCFLVWPALQAQ